MEREPRDEDNLPGSLSSLRAEHEEIQRIYQERRIDMPQAQVKMNVRKVGEKVCVIDIEGDFTAFSENVLMDAYNQASNGGARHRTEL